MSKKIKYCFITVIVLLLFTTCSKDDNPDNVKFVYSYASDITKYVLSLSNDNIITYTKYVNDTLVSTTVYDDQDTLIVVTTKNTSDEITHKSTYKIGSNGYAESSIDTSFGSSFYIANKTYEYENDFLTHCSCTWFNYGPVPDSGAYSFTYTIENENVTISTISFGCKNYYEFNSILNKVNLNFTNTITGKFNRNLIEKATWNYGCPCGPSCTVAYSDFKYEFDNDGYITKKIEIYTPCYHIDNEPKTITRTVTTTLYEY